MLRLSKVLRFYKKSAIFQAFLCPTLPSERPPESVGEPPCIFNSVPTSLRKGTAPWIRRSMCRRVPDPGKRLERRWQRGRRCLPAFHSANRSQEFGVMGCDLDRFGNAGLPRVHGESAFASPVSCRQWDLRIYGRLWPCAP